MFFLLSTIFSCITDKPLDSSDTSVTFDYCDQDEDGYSSESCGGTDCDDNDSSINPDENEKCDEKDNDCNGRVDEGVEDKFYIDDDGDGYGSSSDSKKACSRPSGYVRNDDDCDDSDEDINPDATEIADDGVDNDCNGSGAWIGVNCDEARDNYRKIQSAVDAAESGDKIKICDGEYDEDVDISGKDLTIEGVDTPIITGGFDITSSEVSISDIRFQDCTNGIQASDESNITLDNIDFIDCSSNVYFNESVGDIINSYFNGNTASNLVYINTSPYHSLSIEDSTFTENTGNVLYVKGDAKVYVSGTTITGNSKRSVYMDGEGDDNSEVRLSSDCEIDPGDSDYEDIWIVYNGGSKYSHNYSEGRIYDCTMLYQECSIY